MIRQAQSPAPVAVVHGFPDGPESWSACTDILRASGRVVRLPELPGYGFNAAGHRRAGTPMALAEEIAEQLWPTGDGPSTDPSFGIHVVGHDWGGIAAWMLTRVGHLAAESILSLTVLSAPHPCALHAHFSAKHARYARALARPWLPERWLRRTNYEPFLAPLRAAGMTETALTLVRLRCTDPARLHRMLAPYREPRSRRPKQDAPSVGPNVPMLLLRGEHDPYVSAHHMLPQDSNGNHRCVETLPGVGHWPQLQAPGALAQRLLSFWSEVELG